MAATELLVKFALLSIGDELTFEGVYERRTFWQWLRRAPRKLKIFRIHTF